MATQFLEGAGKEKRRYLSSKNVKKSETWKRRLLIVQLVKSLLLLV